MENANYVQIVPLTWDERFKMYMKCKKKDLATMLAERDKYDFPQGCAECRKEENSVSISASTATIYYGDERN